jgi:hypothetical protein
MLNTSSCRNGALSRKWQVLAHWVGVSSHIQEHESKVYFTEGDVLLAMFG